MKGGKEEEKVMGPLFPRLHVNDTNKGGPRAPPRNKMALYEQFSIPSQRFNSAAVSAPQHMHPSAGGNLVLSASSSQVYGHDRTLFPAFYVPLNEPVHSSEKINTQSMNACTVTPTRTDSERRSFQKASKDINAISSAAECSSRQVADSNTKNSCRKKLANEDDFMVPTIFCSGIPLSSKQERLIAQQKSGPTMSKSSAKCSNTDKRHLGGLNGSDVRSRNSPPINEKEPAEVSGNIEAKEKDPTVPVSAEKLRKPMQDAKVSSNRDQARTRNISDNGQIGKTGWYQETSTNGGQGEVRSMNDNVVETHSPAKTRNVSSFKAYGDTENSNRIAFPDKGLRESSEKRRRTAGNRNEERKDDVSDSSVESMQGLEICPDDVVGAIGPKHFWKARRAIVNQQRVFAVQVFELHRLIKVQKLIAASPHLLEAIPSLGKTLAPSKTLTVEGNLKTQPPAAKSKDDTQTPQQKLECPKENTEGNQPPPLSCEDGLGGGHHDQDAANGTFTSNPPAMPAPPENNKLSTWCLHPPPNQWLVPVMSLSEGLVYKPYTGPCPPAGSFLAPFYASCTPASLPSTVGDFMNSAYGVPVTNQPQNMGVPGAPPMAPSYFPPFSLPVMNQAVSMSAVEQVSHVAASQSNGRVEQHSQSSRNMSHLKSEAFSGGIWRFHPSRDSELQGSTASSPCDKPQGDGGGDPLPLFPTPSAPNDLPQPSSSSRENHTRVIRVVPHNARSATESAARIFRSIQMERQQNDS